MACNPCWWCPVQATSVKSQAHDKWQRLGVVDGDEVALSALTPFGKEAWRHPQIPIGQESPLGVGGDPQNEEEEQEETARSQKGEEAKATRDTTRAQEKETRGDKNRNTSSSTMNPH